MQLAEFSGGTVVGYFVHRWIVATFLSCCTNHARDREQSFLSTPRKHRCLLRML